MGKMVYHNSNKKGFTLAELMIVVAIVIILAGVSIPLFSIVLRKYQDKQMKDLETAAKAAAVSAFYSGYDSEGNEVKIGETGVCTFLYDAENSAVYVLNSDAKASDFINNGYNNSIDGYGINDYSGKVILVTFDGRYYKYKEQDITNSISNKTNDINKKLNMSKGTFEEPRLKLEWVQAGTLLVGG